MGDPDMANLNDVVNKWDKLGDRTDPNKAMHHAFIAAKSKVTKAIMAARKARNTKTYNPKASYNRLEKSVETMLEFGGAVIAGTMGNEKAKVKLDLSGRVQVANDVLEELQGDQTRQR